MIDTFKVIEIMNESMIKFLENKNLDCQKNLKIRNYLEDESIFFKVNKINAYKILESVGVKKDSLEIIYKKLTSPNVFFDLLNKGKINNNDKSIIIKYNTYNREDLFKNKK